MTEIGTVIDGKYEILKEIGRGGMSIVYLAMDKRLNKQWAVKEIRKKGSGKNDEVVVEKESGDADYVVDTEVTVPEAGADSGEEVNKTDLSETELIEPEVITVQ